MNKYPLVLGTVAASVATLVTTTIVADPQPGLHMAAPLASPVQVPDELDENLGAPQVRYESESMQYEVTYPGNWHLNDAPKGFAGHILSDPSEHVVITMSLTHEDMLRSPQGLQQLENVLQQSLKFDPAFTLNIFDRFVWKDRTVLYTEGTRIIGGKTYIVREYNIVRDDNQSMFNVSITSEKSAQLLYEKSVQSILNSLEIRIEP